MSDALVIGGTGPTGVALVHRMVQRGDRVTVVHTGAHETPLPAEVEHVHCDTRSAVALRDALGRRTFDQAVSTSGLLVAVVEALWGRVEDLAAVTGLPAYVGWQVPAGQPGLPVPLREDAPAGRRLADLPGDGLTRRVLENEAAVLAAAERGAFRARVLRYTMVYGPHSAIPFEWFVVRRVLDGRTSMALESDGLAVPQRGYSENLAAAVLIALAHPQADRQVLNVGDERVLSVRALVETVASALGHELELVGVPLALSPCGNPFALRQNTVYDLSRIRALGYRDVLDVGEATARTARWMAEHPIAAGSAQEATLGPHAFDYAAEDRVLDDVAALHGQVRAGEEPR